MSFYINDDLLIIKLKGRCSVKQINDYDGLNTGWNTPGAKIIKRTVINMAIEKLTENKSVVSPVGHVKKSNFIKK